MKPSLLATDYLCSFSTFDFNPYLYTDWTVSKSPLFHTSKEVSKSSMGEHYAKELEKFLSVGKDLVSPIQSFLSKKPNKDEAETQLSLMECLLKITPLAVMPLLDVAFGTIHPDNILAHNEKFWLGVTCPVKEVSDLVKTLFGEVQANDEKLKFYLDRNNRIERKALALCTGYNPKGDMPAVVQVPNVPGTYEDDLIANALYPWVTQPYLQLKMLAPALPKNMRDEIIKAYIENRPLGVYPGQAFDFIGNTFTFDILTDYFTYLMIKHCSLGLNINIQRQAWTPWFGFDYPSSLVGFDPKEFEVLESLTQRSSRLFSAILQTGLTYESQYGVLAGFRGRFMLSGSLGSLFALCEKVRSKYQTANIERVVKVLSDFLAKHLGLPDGIG
jgi:hypothetical protein